MDKLAFKRGFLVGLAEEGISPVELNDHLKKYGGGESGPVGAAWDSLTSLWGAAKPALGTGLDLLISAPVLAGAATGIGGGALAHYLSRPDYSNNLKRIHTENLLKELKLKQREVARRLNRKLESQEEEEIKPRYKVKEPQQQISKTTDSAFEKDLPLLTL